MARPRSSLAIALEYYKGPRPGIALTIAAVALIGALIIGGINVVTLGGDRAVISDGQKTARMLNRYAAGLDMWWQMALSPDEDSPDRQRLRDSIGVALRVHLQNLRGELADPMAQLLVNDILESIQNPSSGPEANINTLTTQARSAMIALTARQDSALFQAVTRSQRSQLIGAIGTALTLLAAVSLIAPISWVYLRHKAGVPPGM